MKKVLIGIFAHPDDEAFCPSAYLYRAAHSGTDVHLILVTDGDSGYNQGYEDLAQQRLCEWNESCQRIGAISNTALHYPDGGLCNNIYLEVANRILDVITTILKGYSGQVELNLLTLEERGVTGHLDHIAVSYITTYLFETLKLARPEGVHVHKLLYYCLPNELIRTCNCNWIYMPAGRTSEEIDERHDFSDIVDIKKHIMQAHESQSKDMEEVALTHMYQNTSDPRVCLTEHFIVRY